MRWKLLLATSLLATAAGAGASLGIAYGLLGSTARLASPDLPVAGALLIPLASIVLASFFVYRHTARRRTLQAILTALIALTLTLVALLAGSALSARSASGPRPAPTPAIKNIG